MLQRFLIILILALPFQMQAQDFTIQATDSNPCIGDTITLNHENNLATDWTIPSGTFEIIGSATGVPSVQIVCNQLGEFVINANESGNTSAITITISNVSAEFEAIIGVLDRNKVQVVSVNQPEPYKPPITFDWDFGDGTTDQESITATIDNGEYRSIQSHTYDLSGDDSIFNISLTVTNNAGCSDSYDSTVILSKALFIPNVFFPTGENASQNNNFVISTGDGTKISLIIFSRWGNIVYESEEPQTTQTWNGRLKDNSMASTGVYYYVITPENNPQMDKKTGFVHLYTNVKK